MLTCLVWIAVWLVIGSVAMCVRDYRMIKALRWKVDGQAATYIPYSMFARGPMYHR